LTTAKVSTVGKKIRRYRQEQGLSLTELATKADISKSYLWSLENEPSAVRTSGETLYKIAKALGVGMSDLLGRRILVEPTEEIPKALREFAEEEGLPESDLRMLATIRFRGDQPRTKERWRYIYNAIRTSSVMDERRR
jgi:transcriptional regulator with XRE-family HTH domain